LFRLAVASDGPTVHIRPENACQKQAFEPQRNPLEGRSVNR
jgi:hypothetical protein